MSSRDPERRKEVNRNFYRFRRGLEVDAALEAARLYLSVPKTASRLIPKKCIAYYRAYTEKPPHPDYEIEAQQRAVAQVVRRAGVELIDAFKQPEKRGRPNPKRHQLSAALAACQIQGATLIIAKLGHLVDSAPILSQLAASGIDFVCLDKPRVNGRTIADLAIAAQQKETTRTAQRLASWAALKAKGYRHAHMTPEATRQYAAKMTEAVRAKSRKFAEDIAPYLLIERRRGSKLSDIAALLNKCEIKTLRGYEWTFGAVSRALKRAEGLAPSANEITAAEKVLEVARRPALEKTNSPAVAVTAPAAQDAPAPTFRTGLVGRDSGFAVIEAEARRLYAGGKRLRNKRTGLESPKAWAEFLLPWYKSHYPGWPHIEQSTLENRLGPVLRDLQGLQKLIA